MPRNGSGTMSVPNSFSSGATISSSAMNANFTDVASELTGSLPRDGQAAMTGQLKSASGTAAAPGLCWSSDTDSGFRRSAANTTMAVAGGLDVAAISDTGIAMQSGMSLADQYGGVLSALPSGVPLPYFGTTAPTGYVLASGKTIGNASSSATERANADTETLFTLLWNSFSNSVLAVSSGRGASAAADFAANKTIALPDLRGRSLFGLDNIGGTAASRLGSVITGATTNGSSGGAETTTIAQANLPAVTLTSSSKTITSHIRQNRAICDVTGSSIVLDVQVSAGGGGVDSKTFDVGGQVVPLGGSGTAFSNMPPAWLCTFIIKL